MQKFGRGAIKQKRFLYKCSKASLETENIVYRTTMANIIITSIPDKYLDKLEEFNREDILHHIGEIVSDILPYSEFNMLTKDTKNFHLIFIKGYIHGGISYSNNLISEAKDESDVDDVPRKIEDILGEIDYGDITDKIQSKIREEIDKDNQKLEEEKEQEEEMVKDLEDEEDDDFEFETGEDEVEDLEIDDSIDDDFENEESGDEETDEDEELDPEDTPDEDEEDINEEDEDYIKESTFEKIASGDPFNNNINKNENTIRLIKQKVIELYSGLENSDSQQAKLDVILYVSIAIAFHELGIMKKSEFLNRIEI